jgi:hypothetical protein
MNKDIQIDGYKLVARLDSVSDTWGGVAMLVKENIPHYQKYGTFCSRFSYQRLSPFYMPNIA